MYFLLSFTTMSERDIDANLKPTKQDIFCVDGVGNVAFEQISLAEKTGLTASFEEGNLAIIALKY